MKSGLVIVFFLLSFVIPASATTIELLSTAETTGLNAVEADSIVVQHNILNVTKAEKPELFEPKHSLKDSIATPNDTIIAGNDTIQTVIIDYAALLDSLPEQTPIPFPKAIEFRPPPLGISPYVYSPLFRDLVYTGMCVDVNWRDSLGNKIFYFERPRSLENAYDQFKVRPLDETLNELRQSTLLYITHYAPYLYVATVDEMPAMTWNNYEMVEGKAVEKIHFEDNFVPVTTSNRIIVRNKEISPWDKRLDIILQFSQNYISPNWYKGGNDYFNILGGIEGKLNYDNKKKLKWENSLVWRNGFNTVNEDTLGRHSMPSDDIFKISSKFGIKATGNFYYSSSLDFETQFFNNPKAINSYEMKARFLTPIRLNIGVGMDYQYKEVLSIALSPLSFKFIYLTDTAKSKRGEYIDPNTFGIKKGENQLKELGSKLTIQLISYRPISNLKLDSKFTFFTNYTTGITVDWEIVAELAFNRFLSTRVMINPRYDSTVIPPEGEKNKLQMKEMLTVGLSYRIY